MKSLSSLVASDGKSLIDNIPLFQLFIVLFHLFKNAVAFASSTVAIYVKQYC
jgi:hypothetical protein